MSDVVKPERLPPDADTSPSTKSVVVSLKVKVTVAVSPAIKFASSDVMLSVGVTVDDSTVSESPAPLFPSESVLLSKATENIKLPSYSD